MNKTASNGTIALAGNGTLQLDDEPIDEEGYSPANHMTFCARENGKCVCDGTVYYGKTAPMHWSECEDRPGDCAANMLTHNYATKGNMKAENPTDCSTRSMGFDPAPGDRKLCFCEPPRI
jgi:hypothetical protein